MRELEYPFNSEAILKKAKKIKRELLDQSAGASFLSKRIAVLGGSTTHDIVRVLELFLLNEGIKAEFYQSEYGQYWQDAMFDNPELGEFSPDVIFVHTSSRNITAWPSMADTAAEVEELIRKQAAHFTVMWDRLREVYHCPVIQNNFEYPFYRLMGNREASDIHGRNYYVNRMNLLFAQYAQEHQDLYIHDINYISAAYGLEKWSAPSYWHMYKYALNMQAIPEYAYNLSHIIKSLFGKNKKAMVLDLDNTLWGGVVGDDGPEQLEIGPETAMGQVYTEIQAYIRNHKELGILLTVNSKNEQENAVAGLNHPDGMLRPDDFVLLKANWEAKSKNLMEIAKELELLPESLVFIDDNPAEREIVRQQVKGTAVPEIGAPERTIQVLDRNGYFEVTALSEEDSSRNAMYQANIARKQQELGFGDYREYLLSLKMTGTAKAFEPIYMARIAQLTNKSNQFNLTTKRFTQSEIEQFAADREYITLCGRLADRFGDNGVVSVVIGRIEAAVLHLDLWLMSCRVLKRDMEYAMMDRVAEECRKRGIDVIRGYYYPTAKNAMVKEFYGNMGFTKIKEDAKGNTAWEFHITEPYVNKNQVIKIVD